MTKMWKSPGQVCWRLLRSWFLSKSGIVVTQRLKALIEASQEKQLKLALGSCGANVSIQLPVCFTQPDKIHIGNDVAFAAYVHIWGGGGLTIGNRVMIGSHSAITTVTHDYNAEVMWGTVVTKPIVIEDDVWIGTHVVVLPGVTIGRGAVIAAGCIVTKDVSPGGIIAGVPGRVLKNRDVDRKRLQAITDP